MSKQLLLSILLVSLMFALPVQAKLSYNGIETTINDDLSVSTNITLKFSGPENYMEYRTTLPVSSFKTSGSFGPVACDTKRSDGETTIHCALSGISADKNTLYLDIESKGAANYSYGRYHFVADFTSSLAADKFFYLVKLPESATLAEFPINKSYSPENGTTMTDGLRIMVLWDSGKIAAGQQQDFRVEYNLPPIRGSVTRYIVLGAGIIILIVVAVAFAYTRRASRFNKGKVIASVLNADEKRVVDIIAASGSGALQKHIVRESGFSKAKVSRLVKSLGGRGIVKVEPVSGRENRILLTSGKEKNEEKKEQVVGNENKDSVKQT